ncbi:hypothetical protein ACTWPF_07465 [Oceanobacillus sp. M65]|uniref:hypothetical protein n=1 Tax=Oceanobacillus sp. M65 TaxID=3457435 RepID=UPI003FCD45D8
MRKLVQMTLITIATPVLIICSILMTEDKPADPVTASAKSHQTLNKKQTSKTYPQQPELKEEKVKELTRAFMDTLVQEADESYRVTNMDTKAELFAAFESIAVKETVEPYVSFYFEEKPDGLYILPTETPPWFIAENPYDMVQLDNDLVKVKQENETALHGAYTIEIEFVYDKQWKIGNVTIS